MITMAKNLKPGRVFAYATTLDKCGPRRAARYAALEDGSHVCIRSGESLLAGRQAAGRTYAVGPADPNSVVVLFDGETESQIVPETSIPRGAHYRTLKDLAEFGSSAAVFLRAFGGAGDEGNEMVTARCGLGYDGGDRSAWADGELGYADGEGYVLLYKGSL